jgi:hypothetical protein
MSIRFNILKKELLLFEKEVDKLSYNWLERINNNSITSYKELLHRPSSGNGDWEIMQSMREIDTSTWIQIKESF